LRQLFETGQSAKVAPDMQARCFRLLDVLDAAATPEDMNLPGFHFHKSRQSLHRILAEEQPITPATALKLGRLLNTTPDVWLNMQRSRDLWEQRRKLADELASIEPVAA